MIALRFIKSYRLLNNIIYIGNHTPDDSCLVPFPSWGFLLVTKDKLAFARLAKSSFVKSTRIGYKHYPPVN